MLCTDSSQPGWFDVQTYMYDVCSLAVICPFIVKSHYEEVIVVTGFYPIVFDVCHVT